MYASKKLKDATPRLFPAKWIWDTPKTIPTEWSDPIIWEAIKVELIKIPEVPRRNN